MADGRNGDDREIGLEEAQSRLAEAEQIAAVLEARLVLYQSTLEQIRSMSSKALES